MPLQIAVPTNKIINFCRKWKITEFSLFGSVLRDDFHAGSDIDVLVRFEEKVGWSLYDVVEMKDDLRTIFGRDVDIIEQEAVRNPFRRRSIMMNREVLYAA